MIPPKAFKSMGKKPQNNKFHFWCRNLRPCCHIPMRESTGEIGPRGSPGWQSASTSVHVPLSSLTPEKFAKLETPELRTWTKRIRTCTFVHTGNTEMFSYWILVTTILYIIPGLFSHFSRLASASHGCHWKTDRFVTSSYTFDTGLQGIAVVTNWSAFRWLISRAALKAAARRLESDKATLNAVSPYQFLPDSTRFYQTVFRFSTKVYLKYSSKY